MATLELEEQRVVDAPPEDAGPQAREERSLGVRRMAILQHMNAHERFMVFVGIFCISFVYAVCDLLRNNYLVISFTHDL